MNFSVTRHSWVLALVLGVGLSGAGCSKDDEHAGGGGHSHQAKNGGQLIEVGRHQFNFEILPDAAAGKLTAWVLDAHAEGYVRIAAPMLQVRATVDGQEKVLVLAAVANAASGEKVGDTSQFEGSAEWLKTAKAFSGKITGVNLGGKDFGDVAFEVKAAK